MERVEEESKKKGLSRVAFVALFVFVIIYLLFIFFLIFSEDIEIFDRFRGDWKEKEDTEDPEISKEELSGEIYLTLSPLGEYHPQLFRLNLENGGIKAVFPEDTDRSYMGSFSPDLQKMVFVKAYEHNLRQVMMFDYETEEFTELTPYTEFLPRNPKFSPDGESIIYWSYESHDSSFGFGKDPEDQNIYLRPLEGNRRRIANGVYPTFMPDGQSIIFLKNEGLYILDLETNEENFVYGMSFDNWIYEPEMGSDGWGWLSIRFTVSFENNLLLITDTFGDKNYILEIESWDPFVYDIVAHGEIEVEEPNWPVFSPDGKSFAVQAAEIVDPYSSQVSIYDSETFDLQRTFSLKDYELDFIWLTDWIVK